MVALEAPWVIADQASNLEDRTTWDKKNKKNVTLIMETSEGHGGDQDGKYAM